MTTATLTDRYIFAATRSVPEKSRADLRAELEASIVDAIDARVDGGEGRDAAERAVLTDLGDPDKLAAAYADRPVFLIGPRYYFEWLRLLKVLLWIVVPIAAFGIGLAQALTGGHIGDVIAAAVVGALNVALHIGFWVTLVFAILERSVGTSQGERGSATKDLTWAQWNPDRLPELRPQGLGRADMVATLVFLALAAGAIVWDRVIGLAWIGGDPDSVLDATTWSPISVLSSDLWPWWIAALFVVMAAEAVLAIAIYVRGRWTWPFAVINAALALAVAVPAIVLLLTGRLINPALLTSLGVEDSNAVNIVTTVVAFVIAGVALWDIADGIIKTVRGPRPARIRR